jgi:hypothetical protein
MASTNKGGSPVVDLGEDFGAVAVAQLPKMNRGKPEFEPRPEILEKVRAGLATSDHAILGGKSYGSIIECRTACNKLLRYARVIVAEDYPGLAAKTRVINDSENPDAPAYRWVIMVGKPSKPRTKKTDNEEEEEEEEEEE